MKADNYKEFNLGGLRVYISEVENLNITALRWGVNTKKDEQVKGLAHFVEHFVFNGSEKYSKNDLAWQSELYGADFNAYTTESWTVYTMDILKENTEKGLKLLANMIFKPKFEEEYLQKEKDIILQEISGSDNDFWSSLWNEFYNKGFERNVFSVPILGYASTVKGITVEDMQKFHRMDYVIDNSALVIRTSEDSEEVLKYVEDVLVKEGLLHKLSSGDILKGFSADEVNFVPLQEDTRFFTQKFSQIGFIYQKQLKDPDTCKMAVLSTILGFGFVSKLFLRIREELGLAYSICCSASSFGGNYLFTVCSQFTDSKNIELVESELKVILSSSDIITDEDLERAKTLLKVSYGKTYNSVAGFADSVFTRLSSPFDRDLSYNKDLELFDKVTLSDVKALLEENVLLGGVNFSRVPLGVTQ